MNSSDPRLFGALQHAFEREMERSRTLESECGRGVRFGEQRAVAHKPVFKASFEAFACAEGGAGDAGPRQSRLRRWVEQARELHERSSQEEERRRDMDCDARSSGERRGDDIKC